MNRLILSSLGAIAILAGGLATFAVVAAILYPLSEESSGFYLGVSYAVVPVLSFVAGYCFRKWSE